MDRLCALDRRTFVAAAGVAAGCIALGPSASWAATAAGALAAPESASIAELVATYSAQTDEAYSYGVAEKLAYDPALLSNELGFRGAGSDAEHAAADWLAAEMEAIGLVEVEKVPVSLDKWQFNGAKLVIEGTDVDLMPASYPMVGTDEQGITAQIVEVGAGTEADYEGLDVEGKIVLAGIDLWNGAWINRPVYEAAAHGAAAFVCYSAGGYAAFDDDQLNVHDSEIDAHLMPVVNISRNQYAQVAQALKDGHDRATLTVDAVVEPGTSYHVVGRIPGHNRDQQVVFTGHYDVYFNGFQDNSCAVGLILGIARAMVRSGYEPQNDIVFVAEAAEEWGASGSAYDWTVGAWKLINEACPEWGTKTVALFNFEMPGFYDGWEQCQIRCVPEYAELVRHLVAETDVIPPSVNGVYPQGYSEVSKNTDTMEDSISYRFGGVPCFCNECGSRMDDDGWVLNHYHTPSDSRDTYSADVMATNLNTFGALAIYVDQCPVAKLDLSATLDALEEGTHLETLAACGGDPAGFAAALDAARAAAEKHTARIADVDARYWEAVGRGAAQEELDALRSEGAELNQLTLKAFKHVQNAFWGINGASSESLAVRHKSAQNNVEYIEGAVAALENGVLHSEDGTSGALDLVWMINGWAEGGYLEYSEEAMEGVLDCMLEERNEGNMYFATGCGISYARTYPATRSLARKAAEGALDADFTEEIELYRSELEGQRAQYVALVAQEIADLEALASLVG